MQTRFFVLLLCLLLQHGAFLGHLSAQAFTQVYRPLGISNELYFLRVEPAPGGGFFAAGEFGTDRRIVVARMDAQGKPVWVKIPGDLREVSNLAALKDGGLLVFNNNGSYHEYFDASVLRLGADGSFIEENIWGSADLVDRLGNVARLSSGAVLASGTIGIEDGLEDHLFLTKFSENGKLLWAKTWSHGNFGSFSAPIELPGGGFYTTAQRVGGDVTAALCRFDADGNFLWGKTYDFEKEILFGPSVIYPDGSLLFSAFSLDEPELGGTIVLVKLGADGTPAWIKTLIGPNSFNVNGMNFYNAQTIVLDGVTNNQYHPVVDNDNFILRISPEGKMLGVSAYGSPTQDFPFDSYLDGEYVVSCGITLDGIPEGATQNASRAFVSRSFVISSSNCSKNFSLTEGATTQIALPTVGTLTLVPETPPLAEKHTVGITNFDVSVQTTCRSVGVGFEEFCPGLEPDALQAASKNLNTLLAEKAALADVAYLRVFDCTGKTILETRAPKAHMLDEKNLPSGIYLYSLELKACGRTIDIAGKTAILAH
jgi:hypothetical protein